MAFRAAVNERRRRPLGKFVSTLGENNGRLIDEKHRSQSNPDPTLTLTLTLTSGLSVHIAAGP